jgi:hypothetical protein
LRKFDVLWSRARATSLSTLSMQGILRTRNFNNAERNAIIRGRNFKGWRGLRTNRRLGSKHQAGCSYHILLSGARGRLVSWHERLVNHILRNSCYRVAEAGRPSSLFIAATLSARHLTKVAVRCRLLKHAMHSLCCCLLREPHPN